MAKATERYEERVVTTTERVLAGITLELTMEEAEALVTLLGSCSAYGPLTGLWQELRSQGIDYTHKIFYANGIVDVIKKL